MEAKETLQKMAKLCSSLEKKLCSKYPEYPHNNLTLTEAFTHIDVGLVMLDKFIEEED